VHAEVLLSFGAL